MEISGSQSGSPSKSFPVLIKLSRRFAFKSRNGVIWITSKIAGFANFHNKFKVHLKTEVEHSGVVASGKRDNFTHERTCRSQLIITCLIQAS